MSGEQPPKSLDVNTTAVQDSAPRRETTAQKLKPYKRLIAYGTATAIGLGGTAFSFYKAGVTQEEVAAYLAPPSQTELSQAHSTQEKLLLYHHCNDLYNPEGTPVQPEVSGSPEIHEAPVCKDLRVKTSDEAHAKKIIRQVEVFNQKVKESTWKWAGIGIGFILLYAGGLTGAGNQVQRSGGQHREGMTDNIYSIKKMGKRLAHKSGKA